MEQTTKDYFIRKIHQENQEELNYNKSMSDYLFLGLVNVAAATSIYFTNPSSDLFKTAAVVSASIAVGGCLGLMAMTMGMHYDKKQEKDAAERARVYTRTFRSEIKI